MIIDYTKVMQKNKIILSVILIFFAMFLSTTPARAITDPENVANNKFGIHIFSEKDLDSAANLVNSSGGDWGYVTIVITEGERDKERWQKVFDQMRRIHLIPIVRLATKADGETWEIPRDEEINNWIAFLNSMNWVVKNRYVVIGNEPNRPNEWGGKTDAAEYAKYLVKFSVGLKNASPDFFVLPAGLDAEKNESLFINTMISEVPDVFDHIDGWTSHAYPTSALDIYKTELKSIGKDLPVFITETGWSNKKITEDEIGIKYKAAFENEWADKNVIAVTPFILNYPHPPFTEFSWQKEDGTLYKYYDFVKLLPKVKGAPVQEEKGEILAAFAQPLTFPGSDFVGLILAKNTGQTIWKQDDVSIGTDADGFVFSNYYMNTTEPTRPALIYFKAATSFDGGLYGGNLYLQGSKNQKISNNFRFESLMLKVQLGDIFARILGYLH